MTSAESPHEQVQALAAAGAAPNGKLSLDDISKHFNIPIADAASILGVCTSVLKRICRENGIARWPYRKFLSGKTVDDVKKEAATEKIKELPAFSNIKKQNLDASRLMSSTEVGLSSTTGNQVQGRATCLTQEAPKWQQGVSVQQGVSAMGNSLQLQGNRSFQHGWSSIQSQTRHIPTYFDDFMYGFPSNGLSCASVKWWSAETAETMHSKESSTNEKEKQYSSKIIDDSSGSLMIKEQSDCHQNDSGIITEPSASFVSLRKRAVECGHVSLLGGISNCDLYKLGKRKRLLLSQVFSSSLRDQWKDINA